MDIERGIKAKWEGRKPLNEIKAGTEQKGKNGGIKAMFT